MSQSESNNANLSSGAPNSKGRAPTHRSAHWPTPSKGLTQCVAKGLGGLLLLTAGCGSSQSIGAAALSVVSEGVVNDPTNKSLRFDLLTFGLERFCLEMERRGAPIRLTEEGPTTGRFFATGCRAQVLTGPSRQGLAVSFQGIGYAWTNLTQRLGFRTNGTVEYAVDFQKWEERVYVYFRPRNVNPSHFQVALVESPLAQVGIALSGVNPQAVGLDLLSKQLRRGFTVVRHSQDGETELSMGILPLGSGPFRPFTVQQSSATTLLNERTSLQLRQQDYVGGVHVKGPRGTLRIRATVTGAAAVDLLLVPAAGAQSMIQQFVRWPGPVSMRQLAPVNQSVLRTTPFQVDTTVPGGDYFVLLDHSAAAGRSFPPGTEPPATVDLLVQLASGK